VGWKMAKRSIQTHAIEPMMNTILMFFDYPPIHWIDDGWFGKDKALHFALHFAFGMLYTWGLHCPVGGVLFSEVFGFEWEMYDSARGTGASWRDLIANNAGLICGTIFGSLWSMQPQGG